MGTGAGAAVGIITKLVDVHATLGGSITAFDVVRDGRWGRLGRLLKGHSARDTGIASKDRNCWKGGSSATYTFIDSICPRGWRRTIDVERTQSLRREATIKSESGPIDLGGSALDNGAAPRVLKNVLKHARSAHVVPGSRLHFL